MTSASAESDRPGSLNDVENDIATATQPVYKPSIAPVVSASPPISAGSQSLGADTKPARAVLTASRASLTAHVPATAEIRATTHPLTIESDESVASTLLPLTPITRSISLDQRRRSATRSATLIELIQNPNFESDFGPDKVPGWTVGSAFAGVSWLPLGNTNLPAAGHGRYALQMNARDNKPVLGQGVVFQNLPAQYVAGTYSLAVEVGVP